MDGNETAAPAGGAGGAVSKDSLRTDIIDALKEAPTAWLYEGADGYLWATNLCEVIKQPLADAFRLEEAGLLVPKWPHPVDRKGRPGRGHAWVLAESETNAE